MGEVATTTAAFRNQFKKATGALHILRDGCDHGELQQQFQASLKVQEVLQQYSPKLPANVAAPLLLDLAHQLLAVGKHELALTHCYEAILQLGIREKPQTSSYSQTQRISHHAQALFGCALCKAAIAHAADKAFQHGETVAAYLAALEVSLLLNCMTYSFLALHNRAIR